MSPVDPDLALLQGLDPDPQHCFADDKRQLFFFNFTGTGTGTGTLVSRFNKECCSPCSSFLPAKDSKLRQRSHCQTGNTVQYRTANFDILTDRVH
jgi:hypothetical protein